ncbi:hypothetical protein Tco_1187381 [Tanacetum coccineum]
MNVDRNRQRTSFGSGFEATAVVPDGTAREYVALFEKLACQLVGVSPSVMEATFIKGLKTYLRASIRVIRPEGLAHAMELAITIEDNQQFEAVTRTGVLLVMDEEDENDEENVENKEGSHIRLDSVEVSLNSLLGFTSPRTMKTRGILGGVVVTVLINSGATHNFLSNEGFEESVGLCKGVKELTMSFNMDGGRILIKGDPSLNRSLVSLKVILRSLKLEKNDFLVELKCLGEPQEARLPTNEAINDLLKEFEDIFQLPEGLPPIRAQDHAINLCEGKGPISVRLYRYPHAEKGEIEKLVA